MTVTPNPGEEPRCQCGARIAEKEPSGRRKAGLCRKCRARVRWQRREQARHRVAAGRERSAVAGRRTRRA